MLTKIKHSLKHSFIYGLGNIATKLIGFILLPLYTKHFTVAEYGILGILEITISVVTQALFLGLPQAYIRFHSLNKSSQKKTSFLSTILVFQFTTLIIFIFLSHTIIPVVSTYFSRPEEFNTYLKIIIYIIGFRVINNLFLSVLRAKEQSAYYAGINTAKFLTLMILNIYFVAIIKIGITGILYAYLIGEILLILLLLIKVLNQIELKFDYSILKSALSFGFPLIFSAMASILLTMGDKYILKLLTNYREVGLYNLGFRIAGVLNIFFIHSFTLAFLPAAYKMFGQEGDKRYYCKMMTYFVFVLVWVGLGISLFGKEVVQVLAVKSEFWTAHRVIPIIILTYIFVGARSVASLGMYLKKKTSYIAYINILILVINIILNFLLIPKFNMYGAALATLISFIIAFFLSYYFADKYYTIPYENLKLFKLLFISIVLFFISTSLDSFTVHIIIVLKFLILLSLPLIIYMFDFYEQTELEIIKKYILHPLYKFGFVRRKSDEKKEV